MIRVTCPGCNKEQTFLDLYAGLTLVCKSCRQGIAIPAAGEKPAPTAATAISSAPVQPAPTPIPSESVNDAVAAFDYPRGKRSAAAPSPDFNDAPDIRKAPESRGREMLLIAAIVLVLAVGGGAIGWTFLAKSAPADVAQVAAPEKKEPKDAAGPIEPVNARLKDEVKPDAPPPKGKGVKKQQKQLAPVVAEGQEIEVVHWYTAEDLPCCDSTKRLPIVPEQRVEFMFLVATLKLTPKALAMQVTDTTFKYMVHHEQFTIHAKSGFALASGLESRGGFADAFPQGYRNIQRLEVETGGQPSPQTQSVYFIVPRKDLAGEFKLQYRTLPAVTLNEEMRIEQPAPPVKKPPIAKKSPIKASSDVEVLEWYTAEQLPLSTPKKGTMPLMLTDIAQKHVYLVAKVKLSGKACAKDFKGSWVINMYREDFTIVGADGGSGKARGMEVGGGFGHLDSKGYTYTNFQVWQFEKEPAHHVATVFFTAPKGEAEAGRLQLRYRTLPSVRLTEANSGMK